MIRQFLAENPFKVHLYLKFSKTEFILNEFDVLIFKVIKITCIQFLSNCFKIDIQTPVPVTAEHLKEHNSLHSDKGND